MNERNMTNLPTMLQQQEIGETVSRTAKSLKFAGVVLFIFSFLSLVIGVFLVIRIISSPLGFSRLSPLLHLYNLELLSLPLLNLVLAAAMLMVAKAARPYIKEISLQNFSHYHTMVRIFFIVWGSVTAVELMIGIASAAFYLAMAIKIIS